MTNTPNKSRVENAINIAFGRFENRAVGFTSLGNLVIFAVLVDLGDAVAGELYQASSANYLYRTHI
ncbi:hypothetical protein Nos7524_3844 [Nostoc sp. PCC 7524]|jgi:hypothetical protein|uniref:hypothetical protein n=1 Tax=Nostoc sp. (strain ATCC 29411 / PCC 7524) TaxID=28072 RepID=UPI00029EF473|nr:hypothetical protein [Nostoc sp. PCC 7524]AFY49618.1 hypothetical protein Nos7524_3844 [Nostoc sp. PCC 7524]